MKVVVAPTAFKGTLSPLEAARGIARGVRAAIPGARIVLCPVADGGDGTREALTWNENAATHVAAVRDPLLRPVRARWTQMDHGLAVLEMADASGFKLVALARRDPLVTTTLGTGQLILAAARGGRTIVVGLGGSATVDGGSGALSALGARFLDARGRELSPGGGALVRLARIDLSGLRRPGSIVLLADVRNRLLGPRGAARVFGPQKGATPADVDRLEAGLARLRDVALGDLGVDLQRFEGGGAAGGLAAGLAGVLGARIVPGAPFILRAVGFARTLRGAALVITGEGRVDRTTLGGKAVGAVIEAAERLRIPVAVVCGSSTVRGRRIGAAIVEPLAGRTLAQAAGAAARKMARRR